MIWELIYLLWRLSVALMVVLIVLILWITVNFSRNVWDGLGSNLWRYLFKRNDLNESWRW